MKVWGILLQILLFVLCQLGDTTKIRPCSSVEFCIALNKCPLLEKKLDKLRDTGQRKSFRKHICKFEEGQIYVCCPRLPRKCGSAAYNKIIGGKDANMGALPWMAALRYKEYGVKREGFHCCGSIINSRYVLTAAHCLDSSITGKELAAIHLGERDLTVNPECRGDLCYNNVVAGYEKMILHPKYSRGTFQNDVALIRLNRSIDFDFKNVLVNPICLAPKRFNLKKFARHRDFTVAGWGFTEDNRQSNTLRSASIPLADSRKCHKMFGPRFDYEGETQICAGGTVGTDTCSGDSGGPLVLSGPSGSLFLQVGIVSYGPNPCGIEVPAVYTSIPKYYEWIIEQLEP